MEIIKRNGGSQEFKPEKILSRIKTQALDLKGVNCELIFKKVIPSIQDKMTTTEIDEILAFICADMVVKHPDYSLLGGRILISRQAKIIRKKPLKYDLTYNFFSAYTFLNKYSLKNDEGTPIELPSMMIERVSNYLGKNEYEVNLFKQELSDKLINCATPIYTNGGSGSRKAMISCNLTTNIDDTTDGILDTLSDISTASRDGAGIGLLIDNIRSKESLVSSFKGNAGGVVRYADMVQSHMRFFKQGSRAGSAALYLSLWHKDIVDFLELRLKVGDEVLRTRDLFTAVVVNDLFMECLLNDKDWYLFCPNDILKAGLTPLDELWGKDFEAEYQKGVDLGIGRKVDPKTIWDFILKSQVDNGNPYVFFKDNANRRNMQNNVGTVRQSNLCIEIVQVSKTKYTPQCALSSINLAEHEGLETIGKSARTLVRLLNRVIDKNTWSNDASKNAGEDQRAIAIGVAGMADFFAKKKISFESEEAKQWNKDITETIYKSALEESMLIAEEEGNYPSWEGSLYSKGETYIEGWSPKPNGEPIPMRNSLLCALLPTASSSILLGVFESFEPVTSNLFVRTVGQGEFMVINQYLVQELEELGLWNDSMVDKIIRLDGSVQAIDEIPEDIRYRYKTVWEIPQRALIDLAAIRNKYVDQSQSMNLYFKEAKYGKISSALVHGWKQGLKTGVYYTRTKSTLELNTKLADVNIEEKVVKRPEDSVFSCFGGGCDS